MLRPGHVIVCGVLSLLCLGVVMVNSAGMEMAPLGLGASVSVDTILLSRSSIYLCLAMLAMGAAAMLPVRRMADNASLPAEHAPRLTGLVLGTILILTALVTVYLPGLSREMNGSHRWIAFDLPMVGALSIQPSEIAKWGTVVLCAWYLARTGSGIRSFFSGLLPLMIACGAIILVILKEDLGTGALVAMTFGCLLLASQAKRWHLLLPVAAGSGALAAAVMAEPYRLRRLETFMDPYVDPQGAGYHMIQSMATVAGGQGWGRGLGNGLQKFGYLPEDTTDFLFAIICEELGIFGAAMVAALYILILWAGVLIVRREVRPMLKLLGLGFLATLGGQALINMLVVTGWAPTKGIPLPLVSSGGTGWILTAASLGVLVAIDRAQAHDEVAASSDTADDLPEGLAA
ncbi:MAG: FtsW/RodA/SpoVE family cell cycle protein [Phycisphaeraceae bacterium]|nr:FtsW/RodA/SpoVE family cell cycle protein [Phycisphaeraceae bacterium]MCW5754425.1 FtsW/RodA/SpoVE family cell cycle protein [Phycisphaeraceae bacterium]